MLDEKDKEIFIITSFPDGRNIQWRHDRDATEYKSLRGIDINQLIQSKTSNVFEACMSLEWKYVTSCNVVGNQHNFPGLLEKVFAEIIVASPSELILPDLILECWLHFRNTNENALNKYGTSLRSEESLTIYKEKSYLYDECKFDEVFLELMKFDTEDNRSFLSSNC